MSESVDEAGSVKGAIAVAMRQIDESCERGHTQHDWKSVEAALRRIADQSYADGERAAVPRNDGSMEVYWLHGAIQKDDGANWTEAEGEEFSGRFLDWLEEQHLGYGGLLGEPKLLAEAERKEG